MTAVVARAPCVIASGHVRGGDDGRHDLGHEVLSAGPGIGHDSPWGSTQVDLEPLRHHSHSLVPLALLAHQSARSPGPARNSKRRVQCPQITFFCCCDVRLFWRHSCPYMRQREHVRHKEHAWPLRGCQRRCAAAVYAQVRSAAHGKGRAVHCGDVSFVCTNRSHRPTR